MNEMEKAQGNQIELREWPKPQVVREQPVVDVSPEDVPHLLDYWAIILKRRWMVLATTLIVFATVAIGTLKQRPLYRGKVTIEIDPEPPNVVNFKEVVPSSPLDVDSYRQTQYKILQSRTLAERVVQDLQLFKLPEFYRSRWLFGLIESDPSRLPAPTDPNPPDPNLDYVRNAVSHVQNFLDVSPVRRSNLVEVSFDSYDPDMAARVANKIGDEYINENLDLRWDQTMKASQWLAGRLVGLQATLEKSQDELQAYASSHSLVFLSDKENMANVRLREMMTEYTTAEADRFTRQAAYNQIKKGDIDELPEVMNDRIVMDLKEKMADAEKQYADVTTWVKPDYPKARELKKQMAAIQSQIDKQKAMVVKNIDDQYQAAVNRETLLAKAIDEQKKVVQDIDQKSIKYNILKQKVDTDRQLYDGLLERMKEAQVSVGLNSSNIRIVDSAQVPQGPAKPRVLLNLALGLVLGLALGAGIAFFQEYLDKTLKSSDDVEHLLRLPSLGLLPKFALNGDHSSQQGELVAISSNGHGELAPAIQTAPEALESYRSLRTSVLLSASPVPRLILVTSALPGEGKTTTIVNLGATLASLGNQVVVVDCDMRRPACHGSMGVPNKPGFVQCLTGHVDLGQALLPVPGVNNLSVIPCGPIPPNPAEILSSPLTGELLRKLRGQFDFVLVDSPPLLSVADSRILATLTDAAVLVTRAHSTPYDVVRRARSLLYGAGARILGVALNGVDLGREGYGYMRGGYGYGATPGPPSHAEGAGAS